MVTAIILDDNLEFANLLTTKILLIANENNFEIEVKTAQNASEILDIPYLYDIYFMDIKMPGLSGIDVVRLLREKEIESEVVFVSSYDTFMQESIFVRPRAFVRKEKLDEDLMKSMKVIQLIFDKKKIFINIMVGKKREKIFPSKVIFCKNEEHYIELHYANQEIQLIRMKISELLEELEEFDFVRIHSRYIVNMSYVEKIKRHEIIFTNGKTAPISRSYQKQFTEYVMKHMKGNEVWK